MEFVELDLVVEKDERQKIHRAIRNKYPGLESRTEKNGKICVTKTNSKSRRDNRNENKIRLNCRFVLWKENTDTASALQLIATNARVNSRAFNEAGTKDKRGVTAQFITTYVDPIKLHNVNQKLKHVKIGNITKHEGEHLKLGDLNGNQFHILLRDCQIKTKDQKRQKIDLEDVIDQSSKNLRDNGFINYYGMQRFGTTSISTDKIGLEILKKNYEQAINLLLKPRQESSKKADLLGRMREMWSKTKDPVKCLEQLRNKGRGIPEGQILSLLAKRPGDYLGSLSALSRNTRLMYVHAVQSLIFNRMASYRMKKSDKLEIGDLVQTDKDGKDQVHKIESTSDIEEYSICDLVLPLPGYDVQYPDTVAVELECLLRELGLSHEAFDGNVKDYRLSG